MPTLALLCALLGQIPDEPPLPDASQPDPAWKRLGEDLYFDPEARRLIVGAHVALREGALEHLLCLTHSKEHESILATDAPARAIHAGLLLTGAEKGHTVRFRPKFEPPAGTPIAITLVWRRDGKTHHADAKTWVRDAKDKTPMPVDWVFAGSDLFKDPATGQVLYSADGGDLITVANFPSAILDVPFASDSSDTERVFEASTEAIPPEDTPVTMILRPAPAPNRPADPPPPATP